MKNNCQDFCIGLAKFLDPNISAGVFPLIEAGDNFITPYSGVNLGYATAAAGEGQELNIFVECFFRLIVHVLLKYVKIYT